MSKVQQESEATEEDVQTLRQDYRLDLNEVESTLEAVPGGSALDRDMPKLTSPSEPLCNSTSNSVYFHIPESNASDLAMSECSLATSANNPDFLCQLTKTEALSARQQVALWLTRTSMSDLSSMPSLENLVVPPQATSSSKKQRQQQNYYQHRFGKSRSSSIPTKCQTPTKPSSVAGGSGDNPSSKRKRLIQRNYSTKSLMGGFSFGGLTGGGSKSRSKNSSDKNSSDVELEVESPLRKCETVGALSGLASNRSSFVNLKNKNCCDHHPKSLPHRKSSLSIFRKLSRGARKGTATPHVTSTLPSECESPYPGMRPVNRLRSTTSSMMCSRCSSAMSMTISRRTSRAASQMSLLQMSTRKFAVNNMSTVIGASAVDEVAKEECKICLMDCLPKEMTKLTECGCEFCKDCMVRYVTFEIMAGAYDLSCPDQDCDKQGVLQTAEIEQIVGKELVEKHKGFRLNTEVALDSNRAWCPNAGCETICHICSTSSSTNLNKPVAVKCPTCQKEFCSICSANWHPTRTCQENGSRLVKMSDGLNTPSLIGDILILNDGQTEIKRCPMCNVPIERDAGCAQMMCKRCEHVFCWFCLTSLDEDFLLRHYDSGECKGRLGHTRASVLWHRAQVIGIFAGFGILLVVSSPLLLVAAPCMLLCDCKGFPSINLPPPNTEQKKEEDVLEVAYEF